MTAIAPVELNVATKPIRVFLVDDHTILRQGLRRLFESEKGFEVVGEARDGREAVDRTREVEADVIIMDLAMPALNGLDATRRILKAKPDAKVLILSMYLDDDYVTQALEAGVVGYVMKDAPANELVAAVRAAARGEGYFTPQIPVATVERWRLAREADVRRGPIELTPREREVLKLLAEGHTVKKVADLLHLSQKTVDAHKTNLMKKLDIHNRVELVKYAIAKKLIQI
ncbi:MAG TPA: response regulator transcription factor [Planctomycetota bacterium]|nr:response regulator transcription factor [Planctomycetota bacterium]